MNEGEICTKENLQTKEFRGNATTSEDEQVEAQKDLNLCELQLV